MTSCYAIAKVHAVVFSVVLIVAVIAAVVINVPNASRDSREQISIGYLEVGSGLPIEVMKALDLPSKFGLDVTYRTFTDSATRDRAFLLGNITFNVGEVVAMAKARVDGYKTVIVHGWLNYAGGILVKADSTYSRMSDLRGKQVAIPSSAITRAFLSWYVDKQGLKLDDFKLRLGPFPLLGTLLERGDVDAAYSTTPFITKMRLTGSYKVVLDFNQAWLTETGTRTPLLVNALATSETFAKSHPETVRKMIRMYQAAVKYMNENPENEFFMKFAKDAGFTKPEEIRALWQDMKEQFVTTWNKDMIKDAQRQLDTLSRAGDILTVVPGDLFPNDYLP